MSSTIETVTTVAEVRAATHAARCAGRTVGLVPTMGYLHDGHVSLMTAAAAENDLVVATIFVNPLQFAADEDLSTYPRDLAGDTAKAAGAGVHLLFVPDDGEMYPAEPVTNVVVSTITEHMEGASRPTHFGGVATVVTKLFSIVGECSAYFGEKDFQQLAMVRTMVRDLSMPVNIVGCPIVREPDRLAMSSRNAYLEPSEREAAPVVNRLLRAGAEAIEAGERDPHRVREVMAGVAAAEPLAQLDYAEVVRADNLAPVTTAAEMQGELRLITAVKIGIPRLLDNIGVVVPDSVPSPNDASSPSQESPS